MPALQQYDYEYYEYGKTHRGSATAKPRISDSNNRKKSTTSVRRTSSNTQGRTSTKTKSNVQRRTVASNIELKTKTTRDITKESTRAVTRVNNTNVKRKNSSKNIDIKNMTSKRQIEKPKEMSLKNAKVITDTKVKTKTKKNIVENVAFSFFVFSILFLICYRSSVINESFAKLNGLKNELEDIKTLNAQIESEIQTQTDLSSIESYAKYQLGMQKPKDSQIQKIAVEKEDKISTPVIIEEEEKSFFEKLMNDIINILD